MKIYYGYGQPIEVTDEWNEILIAEDHSEFNRNRAETRRHCSLNETVTASEAFEKELALRDFRERALATLTPQNRELWHRRHIEGMSVKELAALENVTERAINRRLLRIADTLKKYYEKNF